MIIIQYNESYMNVVVSLRISHFTDLKHFPSYLSTYHVLWP